MENIVKVVFMIFVLRRRINRIELSESLGVTPKQVSVYISRINQVMDELYIGEELVYSNDENVYILKKNKKKEPNLS